MLSRHSLPLLVALLLLGFVASAGIARTKPTTFPTSGSLRVIGRGPSSITIDWTNTTSPEDGTASTETTSGSPGRHRAPSPTTYWPVRRRTASASAPSTSIRGEPIWDPLRQAPRRARRRAAARRPRRRRPLRLRRRTAIQAPQRQRHRRPRQRLPRRRPSRVRPPRRRLRRRAPAYGSRPREAIKPARVGTPHCRARRSTGRIRSPVLETRSPLPPERTRPATHRRARRRSTPTLPRKAHRRR